MSVFFGADYYPEHWDRSRWETDAQLMQKMGLNVVRMGEFSWVKFEPEEGTFDFSWLDEAIEILAKYKIKTIVGTPTAAPPIWLIEKHPEILPVDEQGIVHGFGGRHHDCQSNAVYREHCARIVTAQAKHYANNSNVIGWQIDNELGCAHEHFCTCDSCKKAFQKWLEKKYNTISALNSAWGTAFWSQTYSSFNQIPAPRVTPTEHSPSLLLDWKRFCSDLIVDFAETQIAILRGLCKNQFVTHNVMGFSDKVNYYDLAKNMDFVAQDQYPIGFWAKNPPYQTAPVLAATLDLVRSFKEKTFWMMEQQGGPAGWTTIGRTPRPGQLALWTTQAIAHGADTVVYFRWRTCLSGAEEYWHGILPHNGIPGRRYTELQQAISVLKPILEDVQGQYHKNEVGILYSYDQKWALHIQPHHPDLQYTAQIQEYYEPLFKNNIPVDFLSENTDFSSYKVIFAPLQFILSEKLEEKVKTYVSEGGTLVLTMRTGVKTETNTCRSDSPLPCGLTDVLGIEITDYDCMREMTVPITWQSEKKTEGKSEHFGRFWADIISLQKDTVVLANYAAEYYRDTPAVTEHQYKKGKAYYVATEPSAPLAEKIVNHVLAEAKVKTGISAAEGIELIQRSGKKGCYLFMLNHLERECLITIPEGWTIEGDEKTITLKPYETVICRKK